MDPTERPEAGELAGALAVYARWLGSGDPARAPRWVERLGVNEEELARFREAPHAAGPAYVAHRTVPVSPALHGARAQQRMSGPDVQTALDKAHSAAAMCLFTQVIESAPTPAAGYLRGVPFAVKDLIGVAGMQRTAGSASEGREPFPNDAASVAAIRRHGGAVVGMANLHELAFGGSSANPVFGTVVCERRSEPALIRLRGGALVKRR